MVHAAIVPSRVGAVVFGASAGAIEALKQILPRVPAATRVPIAVVVHLPPRHPSALVDIFSACCAAPVREAQDKQPTSPGIWFAPPDYHLLFEDDRCFALSVDEPVRYSRPSIDVLFESAARVYGKALVAVVLTGASDDGAQGARAVRDSGGFVVVQDPEAAEAAVMPRAACERAAPQLVATLEQIADLLSEIAASRRG